MMRMETLIDLDALELRERSDFYAEPCMLNQLRIAIKMSSME